MFTHETTVTVKKPVQDVFKFIAVDYAQNHPKWDTRCISTELTSKGPMAVGATGKEVRNEMGKKTYTFQITEFEANKKMAFKTTSGPAQFSSAFAFAPADGGTKVTIQSEMKFRGLMVLCGPMMSGSIRKQMDAGATTMAELAGK